MSAERIDRIARTAGTRRTFVAMLAAVAAGLVKVRRTTAQAVCSTVGGVCAPGIGCCSGTSCTYEFGAWGGRCGKLNEEGSIVPFDTVAQVWADRITNRGTFRKARLERRREDRRKRLRRRRRHS
ncbi:MAG: hypothetical protein ACR2J8_09690 [Thermomicrobiales bacterium]